MKKILVVATLGLFTVGALAQGTVNFANRVPGVLDAKVTKIDGVTAVGSGYFAQLWAGPAGSAEGALAPVDNPVAFLNLPSGVGSGYFSGGQRTITGIAAGGAAVIQVRAWDGKGGTVTTWAAAQTAGVEIGKSGLVNLTRTGNPTVAPPETPVNLIGLTGFAVIIPEPTTYALLGLGAAALLLRRRK